MLEAVPTALVAGFSPWTLLIVAGLLSRERPMRRALVFLAAAGAVTLLVGFRRSRTAPHVTSRTQAMSQP